MGRNLLLPAVVVALAAAGGIGYLLMPQGSAVVAPPARDIPAGAHVITLTEDGFVPDTLTIAKGETVAFVTTAGNLFWPASNLHPSHLVYPEFDPLAPVQPNSAWSYTFDKVGEWEYHDHLAPYFTGVITVTQ